MTDNGYRNVETYLNSGNIIEAYDDKAIGQIIEKHFGQKIAVFVASKDDLEYIVSGNPFDSVSEPDHSKRMVVLFHKPVNDVAQMTVYKNKQEDADYYLKDTVRYIINPVIKQLLKQTSTARNWNTITRMLEKIK